MVNLRLRESIVKTIGYLVYQFAPCVIPRHKLREVSACACVHARACVPLFARVSACVLNAITSPKATQQIQLILIVVNNIICLIW